MFDHPEMKHVTQFLQNHLNSILCDATQILCEASKRLRVNEKEKRKKSIEKPIEEIHAVSRNLTFTLNTIWNIASQDRRLSGQLSLQEVDVETRGTKV